MSVTYFFGHRGRVGHLIWHNQQDGSDFLTEEAQEWCDKNLSAPAIPIYELYDAVDPEDNRLKRFGRYLFSFDNEDDALKFKLFLVR